MSLLPKQPEEISHHEVVRALQDVFKALEYVDSAIRILAYDAVKEYEDVPAAIWELNSTVNAIREQLFKQGRY